MEENAGSKELQIKKLESTVKSLSEELIKVCEWFHSEAVALMCFGL